MTVAGPSPAVLVVLVLVLAATAAALWPGRVDRLPRVGPPTGESGGRAADDAGLRAAVTLGRVVRSRARQEASERALADLVAALAAPLRAGVPPAVAVAAAAPWFGDAAVLGPLLRDLCDTAPHGAPLAEVWRRHARAHESPDLLFVSQAWGLSELTGAPLADALASGEQVLRARARARERLAAAAAGPKASMAVLCLLPAAGPVVGAVMGVDPVALYFSSRLATGSLVLGIALGLGGWLWSRRILRRAA